MSKISCSDESKDEPWAWEAREFLRSKLIGEEVFFYSERPPNANRDYGTIYLGSDPATAPNVTEMLVQEGLVSVRKDNARTPSPELQRLLDLEEAAKAANKNKWDTQANPEHIRKIKWTQENQRQRDFVDQLDGKPVNAIIEHVRDGSTVRAFLLPHPDYSKLVPEFQYITLMISGIRVSFEIDWKLSFATQWICMIFSIQFSIDSFGLVSWIQIGWRRQAWSQCCWRLCWRS